MPPRRTCEDARVNLALAPTGTASVVAERVRERLRAERTDPARDPELAAQIARTEVRRHNDFALARGLAPVDDESACVREVLASVAGYGPLQPYLDDPTVEELWINAPDRIFIARGGVSERVPLTLTDTAVRDLVERMLQSTRSPGRPEPAVRRRVAARRQPPARRDPRHHASPLGGERPQVPAGVPRPRPPRRRRVASRRAAAALLRARDARRPERPRLGRHPRGQDDAPRGAHRRVPARRTASSRSRRRSSSRSARPTSSRCRAGSRASRAPARSRCAGS